MLTRAICRLFLLAPVGRLSAARSKALPDGPSATGGIRPRSTSAETAPPYSPPRRGATACTGSRAQHLLDGVAPEETPGRDGSAFLGEAVERLDIGSVQVDGGSEFMRHLQWRSEL